jgi:acyl-CoA thioesterase-1
MSLLTVAFSLLAISVAAAPIRVTCIGDSITSGGSSCATNGQSYVVNLQELLGDNYIVMNAGVSGSTQLKQGLDNSLNPWSYWSSSSWQYALKSNPDIVTIMLGTNDAKSFNWEGVQQNKGDYFTLDYVDMIQQLRALPSKPEVYVMIPPPLYEPYPFEMNQTIINDIYPVVMRDIALVMGAQNIDIYSAFRDAESSGDKLTCDGCHPTDAANDIIATTIAATIAKFEKK